jgi:predicted MFS family arabinose efflux permease
MIGADQARLGVGVGGVLAAVVAVATDSRAVAWVAVVLLGAAVAIRLVAARRARVTENRHTD